MAAPNDTSRLIGIGPERVSESSRLQRENEELKTALSHIYTGETQTFKLTMILIPIAATFVLAIGVIFQYYNADRMRTSEQKIDSEIENMRKQFRELESGSEAEGAIVTAESVGRTAGSAIGYFSIEPINNNNEIVIYKGQVSIPLLMDITGSNPGEIVGIASSYDPDFLRMFFGAAAAYSNYDVERFSRELTSYIDSTVVIPGYPLRSEATLWIPSKSCEALKVIAQKMADAGKVGTLRVRPVVKRIRSQPVAQSFDFYVDNISMPVNCDDFGGHVSGTGAVSTFSTSAPSDDKAVDSSVSVDSTAAPASPQGMETK